MFQVPIPTIFLQVNVILKLAETHLTYAAESSLESYKRGAFLEKTERFSKENPPPIPGTLPFLQPTQHPTINSHIVPTFKPVSGKAPAKPLQNNVASERYNILQRKVDDLEKVHLEGKKVVRLMLCLFRVPA